MEKRNVKFNFRGAIIYVLLLAVSNLLIIFLNDFIDYRGLIFLGNAFVIGFIFPMVTLYSNNREKFRWKKYIYFSITTSIAMLIICELFIYPFIKF